jgi:hypothetical protein
MIGRLGVDDVLAEVGELASLHHLVEGVDVAHVLQETYKRL